MTAEITPPPATAPRSTDPGYQGLIPIVVAATGHRDPPPEDHPRLCAALDDVFRHLTKQHPHSPRLLLSGLAEGADRLIAERAWAAGWDVAAVLPRPLDDYEGTFADDASRAEFRALLARCVWVRLVVPAGTPRPLCYRRLAEWLAVHSQLAIALWDGQPSGAIGGTADVVRLFREGVPQTRLTLPDARPVIHIQTRRQSAPTAVAPETVGRIMELDPQPAGLPAQGERARWTTIARRIERYNRDARALLAVDAERLQRARMRLEASGSDGGASPNNPAADATSWLHRLASDLSATAREQRERLFNRMILCAVLAILFDQLYAGPLAHPLVLILAIIAVGFGMGLYALAQREDLEARYLDARALAEACRVQYFWKFAGVTENVADDYLRDQRDELEWLRQAILTTELGPDATPPVSVEDLRRVRDAWIQSQLNYFAGRPDKPGKAEQNAALNQRWSRRSLTFLVAAVAVTIGTGIAQSFGVAILGPALPVIVGWMGLAYGLLFALAGVSKVYQEVQAFGEQANRYRRMGLSMQLARRQLDAALDAGDLEQARQTLVAIGREALAENGDWLLLHRERPVKVPLA